jgi:hypothetical protein
MGDKMAVTEFWQDVALDPIEFKESFEAHFIGGLAQSVLFSLETRPGYRLFQLQVWANQQPEVQPFLCRYARRHGFDFTLKREKSGQSSPKA